MRVIQMKTEPLKYAGITDISIDREVNRHSEARIRGFIRNEDKVQYQEMLSGKQPPFLTVLAQMDNGKEQVLFRGIVTGFSLETANQYITLELVLKSASYLMDCAVHMRSFQDANLSCKEIYQEICSKHPGGEMRMVTPGGKTGTFLLQYQETDWEFLIRLASLSGSFLVPADLLEGTKIYVGMPVTEEYELEETTEYRMVMEEHKELSQKDSFYYELQSRELYQMGNRIVLNRIPFNIFRMKSRYEGAELIHTYSLKLAYAFETVPVYNEKLTGVSLECMVTEVKEDKVRVELLEDENSGSGPKKWFLYATIYSSPDGTGWYFMPEKGDRVNLYLPTNRETDAYVANSVHLETGSSRNNPDIKSLKNKYGKEIRITPSMIMMTNNKGMKIVIDDQKGILMESDKEISFHADEEIIMTSLRSEVTVVADEALHLQQGGTGIKIEDDISFQGGKVRMK